MGGTVPWRWLNAPATRRVSPGDGIKRHPRANRVAAAAAGRRERRPRWRPWQQRESRTSSPRLLDGRIRSAEPGCLAPASSSCCCCRRPAVPCCPRWSSSPREWASLYSRRHWRSGWDASAIVAPPYSAKCRSCCSRCRHCASWPKTWTRHTNSDSYYII